MRIGVSALALTGRPDTLGSGIARYCFELIDALLELDERHEWSLWVGRGFEVPASWRAHPRCTVHRPRGPWADRKTLWELMSAGAAARGAGCDLWFSTAHALPRRWSGPTVLAVQDLFTFTHPSFYTRKHRLVVGRALDRALRRADGLLAISAHTRDELVARGIDPSRITVTPLALAQRWAAARPEPLGTAELRQLGVDGEEFVLTVGTIEPRKNLPRLFEAFGLLAPQDRFARLRLVVAGLPGWKTGPSLKGPDDFRVASKVDFVGFVPDEALGRLIASCRAFVVPSVIEGFGLPLLEALACGAPVASSRGGALPEVGGELPVYFEPTDVEDMAAAITRALTSRLTVDERLEAGRRQVARFSWAETARRTLERLERTVEAAS